MKVLPYLRQNKGIELAYSGRKTCGVKMKAYVDAAHATCIAGRRSVSGQVVLLGGAAVGDLSRTNEVTAVAMSEFKPVAMAEIVQCAVLAPAPGLSQAGTGEITDADQRGQPSSHRAGT